MSKPISLVCPHCASTLKVDTEAGVSDLTVRGPNVAAMMIQAVATVASLAMVFVIASEFGWRDVFVGALSGVGLAAAAFTPKRLGTMTTRKTGWMPAELR